MQKSYTGNFFQIYFWQMLGFSTQILSIFILSPRLTSTPGIYGIYAIVTASAAFLNYSDIGFLGAAQKYASESFARNDRAQEIKIIGFVTFIMAIFFALFTFVFITFYFQPQLLIKDLISPGDVQIAQHLFLIMICFSPLYLFNRVISLVFSVRLEDYIIGRFSFFFNLTNVLSVFYFFAPPRYDIVGYFLFAQFLNLIQFILLVIIARKKFRYDFLLLLRSIRFSREIYNYTKKLAFNTVYISLLSIIYFELDILAIGMIAGADATAIYSIGNSFLFYLRSIFTIIFTPFLTRFNHLIGLKDEAALKNLFKHVVIITFPITVLPICALNIFMNNFIHTWIGSGYQQSIPIAILLNFVFIYHFFTQPAYYLIYSKEKVRTLFVLYTIQPLIFWIGVGIFYQFIGTVVFAVFKVVVGTILAAYYFKTTIRFLEIKLITFLGRYIARIIPSIGILVVSYFFITSVLPMEKSTWNFILTIIPIGLVLLGAFCLYFIIAKEFRTLLVGDAMEIFPFLAKFLKKVKR